MAEEEEKVSLVEAARAAIRAKRRQQLREIRERKEAALKREHDWQEYEDILFMALPIQLAQRDGVTSSSPAMQSVYIEKADEQVREHKEALRVKTAGAQPTLQRIIGLQNEQGFWRPSEELVEALGGHYPDAPEGIVDWRWATACALAAFRRHPGQWQFLQESHDKAIDWVQPPWLLESARDSLPPDDCYFPLDATAVHERRWRDSEGIAFQTLGYEAFVQPPEEEGTDATTTTDSTTASEWVEQQRRRRRPPAQDDSKKKHGHGTVTDPRRHAKHMDSLARDFNQLTKRAPRATPHHPSESHGDASATTAHRRQGHRQGHHRDVDRLRDAWTKPVGIRGERERLEKSRAAPREATPWDDDTRLLPRLVHPHKSQTHGHGSSAGRSIGDGSSSSSSSSSSGGGGTRRSRPRSRAGSAASDGSSVNSSTFLATMKEQEVEAVSAAATKPATTKPATTKSTMASLLGGPEEAVDEYAIAAAKRELDAAQLEVVEAIAQYDRYRRELLVVGAKCAKAYRTARLHSQRQDAFDELTEMLGPYKWARAGFTDWRGRPVKGMQTVTIRLVEAVVRWRAALVGAGRAAADEPPAPFLWENKNILLTVVTGLDFLGARYKELVDWYSPEYTFWRNPLGRANVLDERPPTPPSPMIKVQIDGKTVLQLNERLLVKTQAAEKVVEAWALKQKQAPRWWPDQGEPDHQRRMRAVEKVLLEEEQYHGRSRGTPAPAR